MSELSMKLLPAEGSDAEMLWHWRNHPSTRDNSVNSKVIGWAEHQAWFNSKDNLLLAHVPVGVIRVDDGEVSLTVAPEYRGRGFASEMIRLVDGQTARVKPENVASFRAFLSAGYVPVGYEDGLVLMRSVIKSSERAGELV